MDGLSRGGAWLRTGGPDGRTWLERGAIRPGENGYFDAALTCDGIDLVRLRPELTLKFDPETLTLTFEPRPDLLGTSAFTVQAPGTAVLPTVPLLNFDYDLSAGADLNTGTYTAAYNVQAGYLQGDFSASAGLRQSFRGSSRADVPGLNSLPFPYAAARYDFSPETSAHLAFNLQPRLNLWRGTFTGLQAETAHHPIRLAPPVSFTLPLAATVRVQVDGHELQTRQFPPGQVTLSGIPLSLQQGAVVIEIQDDAGTRAFSVPYSFPPNLLAPGSYDLTAEGGLLSGNLYAGASGRYGLNDHVTLEGAVGVLQVPGSDTSGAGATTAYQGTAWVVLAPDQQLIRLGVGIDSLGSGLLNSPAVVSLRGQYRYARPGFSAELNADVPLIGPRKPAISASARYTGPAFSADLSGGYDPGLGGTFGAASGNGDGWYARLEGNVPVRAANLNVTPFVTVTSRSTRVGVGVNWTPDAQIQVQAGAGASLGHGFGANAGQAENDALNSAFHDAGFRIGVSDQLTPQSRVTASTDLQSAAAGYTYRGPVQLDLGASTNGSLGAQLQGRVNVIGGRVSFAADQAARRFVLLKTGIPNLGVRAEGQDQGRTDANGDLLLSVQSGEGSQIEVDSTTLPITVSLLNERLTVTLPQEGAAIVDWRANFTRSRFVRFQDGAGNAASGGTVLFGTNRADLDDSGEGLLNANSSALNGILTFSDGRRCAVTLPTSNGTDNDVQVVTCDDAPAAPTSALNIPAIPVAHTPPAPEDAHSGLANQTR